MRTTLLDDLDNELEKRKKSAILHCHETGEGSTIISDGRKSQSKRPMVNFLLHNKSGAWMEDCVDSSDCPDDEGKGVWLFKQLKQV